MQFLKAESVPHVEVAEEELLHGRRVAVTAHRADEARDMIRGDFGRWSRWLLGLLGTAGTALASLGLGFAVWISTSPDTTSESEYEGAALLATIAVALALVLAVPSVWLLVALHRSGRRLARAGGYWAAYPYLRELRRPTEGDYFRVRWLGFERDMLPRVTTSALSLLAAAFSISLVWFGLAVQPLPALVVIAACWSVLFVAVMIGQFGGVQRWQNGYSHRDPLGFERRAQRRRRKEGQS